MSFSVFLGFLAFSAVASFTPGPNNLLALASGANFGYRRTLPHVFGVCLGFNLMFLVVSLGLGEVFKQFPLVYQVLKYASLAYLVYLAWKIIRSDSLGSASGGRTAPISLLGSMAFQWVNPKAWMATITILTTFIDPAARWTGMAIAALVNFTFAFSSVSTWAVFGSILKTWLSVPLRLRLFNWTMGILLLASVVPSVIPSLMPSLGK